jgi:hypothetical protein
MMVSLQHRTGKAMEVILPFSLNGTSVTWEEPVIDNGSVTFF